MKQHLSLDNFKKWMEEQEKTAQETSEQDDVGYDVQSKIPFKRLRAKIEIEDGDEDEVCEAFLENGGVVKETDGKKLMIEVSCGSFFIHRSFVERN